MGNTTSDNNNAQVLLSDDENSQTYCSTQSKRPSKGASSGDTVTWIHKVETIFFIIFIAIIIVMIIVFGIGTAVDGSDNGTINIWIHGFAISLSLYEVVLIFICAVYCWDYPNIITEVKALIKFNKFWFQSFLCMLYNAITFLLLIIQLSTQLNQNKITADNSWFFANAMVYLFGIFSISFPVICLRLNQKSRIQQTKPSRSPIALTNDNPNSHTTSEQILDENDDFDSLHIASSIKSDKSGKE